MKPHIGKSAHRLSQENPREVAFAEQWAKEQAQGRVLEYLIGKDYSERDAIVAATVIQWLGSNVGMSFIEESARREPLIMRWLNRHQ